jgi:TrmH family RNA methyltransferase
MAEILRSSHNPLLKRLKELATDSAARRAAGSTLVEGLKLAKDLLKAGAKPKEALLAEGLVLDGEWLTLLKGVPLRRVDSKQFKSVSGASTPQGLMLVLGIPELKEIPAPKLAVAAEGIQDPGNLGTLLRSAWAAGVETVYLSKGCADAWSPKVVRAAAGAHWHVNVLTERALPDDFQRLIKQGVQVLGLDLDAKKSLWDCDLEKPSCLVVGAEGQGLSPDCLRACGMGVKIEYPGAVESLNAGVSLSLALFEALRQRRKRP